MLEIMGPDDADQVVASTVSSWSENENPGTGSATTSTTTPSPEVIQRIGQQHQQRQIDPRNDERSPLNILESREDGEILDVLSSASTIFQQSNQMLREYEDENQINRNRRGVDDGEAMDGID